MKTRSGGPRVTPSSNRDNTHHGSNRFLKIRIRRSSWSSSQREQKPLFRLSKLRASSFLTQSSSFSEEDSHQSSSNKNDDVIMSSQESTEVMINNRDASTLYELGMNKYKAKQYQKAIDFWCQTLQTGAIHNEANVLLSLVKVYVELKQTEPQSAKSHEVNARRYLNKLRPYIPEHASNSSTVEPSALVLDFFVEQKEWDAAIQEATKLKLESGLIARFYYERGIQPSSSNSTNSARMDSMKQCLACRPPRRLVLAARAELIKLHTKTGNYLKALEHHEERLGLLESKSDITKAFYEEGELYLALDIKEKALLALEKGLEINPKCKTLQQAKADLLYKFGRIDESNAIHEELLQRTNDPLEQTKILYTMGRICHKSGRRQSARKCYQRELEITQKIHSSETHMDCSRIYHELAMLADENCDYDDAIDYLQKALEIERLHFTHVKEKSQLMLLTRQTQTLIGKLHYKKGDLSRALQQVF
eukprot:CAMPEP_0194135178 /NCGR_PEP_ID=MMETSP0152-20130528/5266_1 /TAXON_ID=1049557 /ORGANISM="Thalassiothrix antarctica, Strain L6-D1" /LENGTH=477 /DNA_ID=CAMNT_0038831285 /DNA_START=70 /DNA_END=1503 /DNA_ORIENTATION=+